MSPVATSRLQVTHVDEDGEPERFCRRCDEWWPDDSEFWFMHGRVKVCKACQHERNRQSYERRMQDPAWRARKYRAVRVRRRRARVGVRTAAGWAYQYAGALMAAGLPPDDRLLDVLNDLQEGRSPVVEWPALVAA